MKRPSAYQSYLLRLWSAGGTNQGVWHASLESAHTGERIGFGSLAELFDYLCQQTSDAPTENADPAEKDGT